MLFISAAAIDPPAATPSLNDLEGLDVVSGIASKWKDIDTLLGTDNSITITIDCESTYQEILLR